MSFVIEGAIIKLKLLKDDSKQASKKLDQFLVAPAITVGISKAVRSKINLVTDSRESMIPA